MNRSLVTSPGRIHWRGFTLTELLVVLAIMSILVILAIPAIGPMLRSYNLNRASSMVTDELTYCHQAAMTKNADVEFRFYYTGSSANTNDLQYRAFRAILSATDQPLDKIKYLPDQVIISSSTNYSSLLNTNASASGISTNQEVLPAGSSMTPYVSFLFRATGGTSLTPVTPPNGIWFMTLYLENAPINAGTGLPSNYVTAQIDPVTCNVKTYRP